MLNEMTRRQENNGMKIELFPFSLIQFILLRLIQIYISYNLMKKDSNNIFVLYKLHLIINNFFVFSF